MTRRHRVIGISIILVIGVIATVLWLKRPKPIDVILTQVEQGEVERTVTNTRAGTLMACRRA